MISQSETDEKGFEDSVVINYSSPVIERRNFNFTEDITDKTEVEPSYIKLNESIDVNTIYTKTDNKQGNMKKLLHQMKYFTSTVH